MRDDRYWYKLSFVYYDGAGLEPSVVVDDDVDVWPLLLPRLGLPLVVGAEKHQRSLVSGLHAAVLLKLGHLVGLLPHLFGHALKTYRLLGVV